MWHEFPDYAVFESPQFTCRLSPAYPDRGITGILLDGKRLGPLALMQVTVATDLRPGQGSDHYIRQNDLVVTFPASPTTHIRPQIYWRALAEPSAEKGMAPGIELILSVETDLVGVSPRSRVTSQVAAQSVLVVTQDGATRELGENPEQFGERGGARPSFVLVRIDEHWSYVEMAFPGDAESLQVQRLASESSCRISWDLFSEPLEKGVIRRARLRGHFLPSAGADETSRRLREAFLAAPLPLTV